MRGFIVILIMVGIVVASLTSVDAGLYIGYVLFITAIASAIVLPLLNAVKSPGELKKPLIAILIMVALFAVSYALTGSDVTPEQAAKGITESTSKLVGAGLTLFYLISGIAVVGLIYSEINKAFK
jgi:H+/Cl- antiporter ClcA